MSYVIKIQFAKYENLIIQDYSYGLFVFETFDALVANSSIKNSFI